MNKKSYINYLYKILGSIFCICIIPNATKAQCPNGTVNLLAQDSSNYVVGNTNYISNNATLTCNAPPFYVYVNKSNMTTTGDIATPCILSQYNVGVLDGNFCSNATETIYEGSIDLLCIGPSPSCVYKIGGGPCPFTGSWGISKIYLDPGQQHNFQFCDNSLSNVSTTVQLLDCWSGAPLSPVSSFSLITLGNPCFTDSVLANTPIGTANFGIAPASGTVALTDYHNGKSFINPALLSGGTYTVTYTFVPPGSCSTTTLTGTFKFTILPSPTVTVNSATICAGNSAILTASGAGTYSWSTSATGTTITVSPTVTTTYTVTGTTSGCSSTKTTSVTVNSLPTVTANASDTNVCAGATATLTGGGANTYTWTGGISNGVAFIPPSTQTYTVTGTDVNGCKNSATKTITVNPLPTVTANASATPVCAGSTVTLTGGGASTYTWSNGITDGVAFVPPSTQTYTVSGTDVNGCTNSATKTITVNPLPTVTANASATTVCAGSTVTLTGGGATTYTWSSGVSNGLAFVPPSTQTYTVTGTDVNGCTNTATKTITVNPLPTVTANASATIVCAGSTVTLTGGGATTYTWSSGVSNGVAFVPPSTQTYTVTGTDVNGCQNSATKTITVNPLPTITANASATTVCAGSTVTLTGGGASTYTWSNGVTDGVAFVPPSTQTYTVTGTDANGCSNSATKTITVNPLPTVTANASATNVCAGNSVTLTGGGATTYTWSSGVSNGIPFIQSSTQTYTVTGADVNGCQNSATKTITVNPLPTVIANATSTVVCSGSSVTLTGGGASTYTWSSGISNGVAFVPSSTQTYTVTGTDVNGCSNSATKTITVNPLPTVTANASATTVCAGSTVTLTGGGANTYTWSSGISNGVAFFPSSTQTYTVTGTDANGCSNSATKTITVNSLPTVTANATTTVVCVGGNITLTGGGANTYTWSSGVSNGVSFIPSSTQTYTVTGTDVNGCKNSATKTIIVNPLPTVTANASSNSICTGASLTLTGGGANTYTWSSGVSNGVTFVPPSTQTYTVTGTDVNGCSNSAVKTITVNPLPTVTANATATTVCSGSNVTLTGGGASTYSWSNGVSDGVTFILASTQTYTVTGTDVNGCTNSATKTITVDLQPTISNAGPNQNLCALPNTTLSANAPTVGSGAWSVLSGSGMLISNNSPTSAVTGLNTGQTIFMWTISNGTCPASTSTVSVKVDTLPTTADAGPDVSIYTPTTNLNANTPLIGNGIWSMISGGGNISSNSNPSTQVTGLQFGQNVFHWTISNGACPASVDEVIITVHELVIPNGFSPNGDNVNDNFEIPGITQYSNVKLDVFNRWGNLVYQNNDYKNDWGGKNNSGEDLTDDTYYFTLEITGKKTYKGYVVLKRK